ncbi:universal stress protein [Natronobacterium gregoryi]|uniref:Universal stress protein n=2 Tax=Natronobacterium gregoryi TaxID=44930 RepID=L0AJH9_NATGS|nr:universal stress protein [Natronobacterium gregoryi]AFZ74053.1 universal stress protein UspA-like protein [Natronobacterium gregoryi SP2]ELY70354.1 UspA domain-containing protein [Natronobacterium gregoryi SP2]PLK20795.1 universal stress protein [Natronobacterium gregoryi SP2]SFJ06705.1 Nucleotide-binding universal stress protein, UspA family [Natronobacterium gregoryi]
MYDNVLIATDGSDAAQGCVDYGLEVAERTTAKIHAVYVVETKATYILTVGLSDAELEQYKEYGRETVTEVVEEAVERGLEANGVVKTGRPSEEIAEYASDNDVDAVVMGKQGHGAVDRHLGSTAENVMRRVDDAVTVVVEG